MCKKNNFDLSKNAKDAVTFARLAHFAHSARFAPFACISAHFFSQGLVTLPAGHRGRRRRVAGVPAVGEVPVAVDAVENLAVGAAGPLAVDVAVVGAVPVGRRRLAGLAPEASGLRRPRVLVPVRVQHRNDVPVKVPGHHARGGGGGRGGRGPVAAAAAVAALRQPVDEVGGGGGGDPLAGVDAGVDQENVSE